MPYVYAILADGNCHGSYGGANSYLATITSQGAKLAEFNNTQTCDGPVTSAYLVNATSKSTDNEFFFRVVDALGHEERVRVYDAKGELLVFNASSSVGTGLGSNSTTTMVDPQDNTTASASAPPKDQQKSSANTLMLVQSVSAVELLWMGYCLTDLTMESKKE